MWLKVQKGQALVCNMAILAWVGTTLFEKLTQLSQNWARHWF